MVVAEVCSTMKYPKRSQYKHAKQKKYHVRNWAEYNEGLRRRGDLTVWFDEEAIANWMADKTGKPGGQRVYSDLAIETSLVVRMVYKLAYRQTEGFLNSIASLLGLGIEIPDYSTLCRRSRLLRKKLRIPKAASSQPIHLMIDSTGLRIHVGTARKPPKQRAWRKLHIAVDRKTGNIVASELTASRARDATRVPALLTQIQAPLVSVAADSAYDKEAVYETIEAHSPGRRTRVVIPPQRNATLSQNSNTAMQERDRHIRAIERHGRREWYKLSGCTKRSMVENAVYRYKAIIGPEMRTRTLARQRVEHRINREDFSFVIHLDRQPRTSRRREAQTGSRARSGSRSERNLDAVEHSRTLMEWWPFLIFHRGGLRIKVINNSHRRLRSTHRRLASDDIVDCRHRSRCVGAGAARAPTKPRRYIGASQRSRRAVRLDPLHRAARRGGY